MHPTCWSCMGNFARIIKKVPRIQEEPTLLTKNIYFYPLKSTIDCLSLVFKHPQSSIKSKTSLWDLLILESESFTAWCVGLLCYLKKEEHEQVVHELPSKELSFDIWQQASRQIVFERKRTVGRGVHSWMNIACNSWLFHPLVWFAENIKRWSLHTLLSLSLPTHQCNNWLTMNVKYEFNAENEPSNAKHLHLIRPMFP